MGSDVSALPKIYCVSLARAADRRRRMVERLQKMRGGVNYEIVDAVDGSTYDLSSLGSRLRQDVARRHLARDLSKAEIGCYLSHYNLWQRFADEGVRSAIVVEDDANFSDDFLSVADAVCRMPYDWDVIVLHTHKNRAKRAQTLYTVGDGAYRVIRSDAEVIGTVGYLISAAGVNRLLSHCFEIDDPIDVKYCQYWMSGIKYYAVHPAIVTEDGSARIIQPQTLSSSIKKRISRAVWRRKQKVAIKVYNWRNPLPQNQTGVSNHE